MSGTVELKSYVTLRLAHNATLLGSSDLADYPEKILAIRSYTDEYTRRSLVHAENLDHVAIEGDEEVNVFPIVKEDRGYKR